MQRREVRTGLAQAAAWPRPGTAVRPRPAAGKPAFAAPAASLTSTAAPAAASPTNQALSGLSGWFVPQDWGASWRAALTRAQAGKGLAVAALVGDSVGHGYWASNLYSTAWTEILRNHLTDLAGYGGSGFQSQAHSHSVMYNPGSGVPQYYTSVPGNVWQQSGNWSGGDGTAIYGPGSGAIVSGAAGATAFNYVLGSTFGVWYYDSGSGFDVAVDGAKVGTVTVGTSGTPKLATFALGGGANAVHSWQITAAGAGTAITGVLGTAPTGVRLDNFSFPGLFSRAVANTDGRQSGTYCGGWRNPADLVIYELAGNDIVGSDPAYPQGVPPDVWAANVQSYLEGVLGTGYGGTATGRTDVLFLFPVAFEGQDQARLTNAYKARALGLAQLYGAALFDLGATFHTSWYAWQQAGYAGNQGVPTQSGQDGNHPSDAGHALLGNALAQLLAATS